MSAMTVPQLPEEFVRELVSILPSPSEVTVHVFYREKYLTKIKDHEDDLMNLVPGYILKCSSNTARLENPTATNIIRLFGDDPELPLKLKEAIWYLDMVPSNFLRSTVIKLTPWELDLEYNKQTKLIEKILKLVTKNAIRKKIQIGD